MNEIEETWSPEPVKAWRYWRVSDLEWNWEFDRFEAVLIGDRETWDSPVKFAGQHTSDEIIRDGAGNLVFGPIDHSSPHTGCPCGVNAVKDVDWTDLRTRGVNRWIEPFETVCVAVAPVDLAGTVDEYERGYRAEQATISGTMRIFNGDQKRADALSRVYGLEVLAEDWDGSWCQQLALDSRKRRQQEEADGHRKADTSDHRGTGTSQDTGAGKRTRKDTLTRLSFALGIPLVWLSGAHVMALSDAWWSFVAWFVACGVGTFGTLAHADFLKHR